MDINVYAKQSHISRKVLRWMARNELIHDPLSEQDLLGLALLEKVWGRTEIVRGQISKYSKTRRAQLLTSPDLDTKWERYAYSRFCNLEKGCRLPMKRLVHELELTFGFILQRAHIKKLYKVRQRVYNRRKSERMQDGNSSGEI